MGGEWTVVWVLTAFGAETVAARPPLATPAPAAEAEADADADAEASRSSRRWFSSFNLLSRAAISC